MAYKTGCQRGFHNFDLGFGVETKKRCVYCGTHKFVAAIKALFVKVGA
ncbi:hypothetical protein FDG92_gp52 [Arthrobacter phage Jasmine]|uniref:Uncharacterized protein n=1 Tax=Arthrobacter phage Jasmine TaxID=1772302 RepID=A0A0U4JRU4_9CAUD|nr:hypothetical protein FDG92_gp52 [Arthrobacter phage Jasmine]ALY09323.1 hypothetical protein JASMINE_53 [Arthrobacter phage Jasmine]